MQKVVLWSGDGFVCVYMCGVCVCVCVYDWQLCVFNTSVCLTLAFLSFQTMFTGFNMQEQSPGVPVTGCPILDDYLDEP